MDTISSDHLPERNFGRPIKHANQDDLEQDLEDPEESISGRSTVHRDSQVILHNYVPTTALPPNEDDLGLNRNYSGCPEDTSTAVPSGQMTQHTIITNWNSLLDKDAGDAPVLMHVDDESMVNTRQYDIDTQVNLEGETGEIETMNLPDPAEPWTLELPQREADRVEAEVLDDVELTTITIPEHVAADDTAAQGVSKHELEDKLNGLQEDGDLGGKRHGEQDNGKEHGVSWSTTTRLRVADLLKNDGATRTVDESEVGSAQKAGGGLGTDPYDDRAEECEAAEAVEKGQDAYINPHQSVSSPEPAVARDCTVETDEPKRPVPTDSSWKLIQLYVTPAGHRQEGFSTHYERALVFITMVVVVLRILWMAWLLYQDCPGHGSIRNIDSSAQLVRPPWSDTMSAHIVQCYAALAEDDLWTATHLASILELQLRQFWQAIADEHREQQQQEVIRTCRALDEIVRSIMGTAEDEAEVACTQMIGQR